MTSWRTLLDETIPSVLLPSVANCSWFFPSEGIPLVQGLERRVGIVRAGVAFTHAVKVGGKRLAHFLHAFGMTGGNVVLFAPILGKVVELALG